MVTSIKSLIADAGMLSDAAIAGNLVIRADASRHQGDFRKIVVGVNGTLDAIIGPLNVAAEYVDRIAKGDIPPKITDTYSGDFNEIKNNLNGCIDAVNLLRGEGMSRDDALVEAGLRRMRPILMTTLCALLGALPLMLGQSVGSELRSPLGVTMVGGLIVSQMLRSILQNWMLQLIA